MIHYTLSEVMSARKGKTEEGIMYLDLNCGNLLQNRITRILTENAYEISRLIKQYINIEQRMRGHNQGDLPNNVTLSRDNPRDVTLSREDANYTRFKPL